MAKDYSERRNRARELRRSGLSYSEIRQKMGGGSHSSLVKWLSDIPLSEAAQDRINRKKGTAGRSSEAVKETVAKLSKANSDRRKKRWEIARAEAEVEWATLSSDPGFMFGLGLYIGEGDKQKDSTLGVSNCDPEVIRMGLAFFSRLGVPKDRVRLNLNMNYLLEPRAEEAMEFWSRETGVPIEQFRQTVFDRRKGRGKSNRNPWPNGCCHARVNDTLLKQKMKRWVELAKV
jgi:hypothetical protein